MATPKAIFRGALNRDISHAVGLSAWASPFFVLYDDAEDATALPLDPISQIDGTAGASDADNIRQVVVPNSYYYLNLCLCWFAASAARTYTTAPTVHVFGLLPREQKQDRAYPQEDTSVIGANTPDLAGDSSGGRFWVPLLPEDGTSGSAITLNSGKDMELLYDSDYMSISKPISIYLAGVRRIICTVATAGTEGASVTGSCVGGWFSG